MRKAYNRVRGQVMEFGYVDEETGQRTVVKTIPADGFERNMIQTLLNSIQRDYCAEAKNVAGEKLKNPPAGFAHHTVEYELPGGNRHSTTFKRGNGESVESAFSRRVKELHGPHITARVISHDILDEETLDELKLPRKLNKLLGRTLAAKPKGSSAWIARHMALGRGTKAGNRMAGKLTHRQYMEESYGEPIAAAPLGNHTQPWHYDGSKFHENVYGGKEFNPGKHEHHKYASGYDLAAAMHRHFQEQGVTGIHFTSKEAHMHALDSSPLKDDGKKTGHLYPEYENDGAPAGILAVLRKKVATKLNAANKLKGNR